ncbi:MAG TPA: hypothetical protein P5087_00520 [Eubacteriales bacterium]|nr:hypothetical protein [Eubacteriales bacterium]
MIYKNSYFNRELKEAYIVESASRRNGVLYGFFYVVITIAFHLVLNTLNNTVFGETFPELTSASIFSVVFLYNFVALALFVIYLVSHYQLLTFQEISDNRWYPLIKNGYSVNKMITAKLLARFFRVLLVYSVGFLGCLLLGGLIGYQIVTRYLASLYFVGLSDILLIYMISLTISNFVKKSRFMSVVIIIVFVLVKVLQTHLGYYSAISDVVVMSDISNLFVFPKLLYIIISSVIFFACLGINFLVVRYKSKRFSMTKVKEAGYYMDYMSDKIETVKKSSLNPTQVINIAVTSVIALLVLILLAFNVAVLLSTDFGGLDQIAVKPILFQSTTMSPVINMNDLTFFEKAGNNYSPKLGDIVLFESDGEVFVETIVEIVDQTHVVVDITNYSVGTEAEFFVKTIQVSSISRIYIGTNRWLGAVVAFSRSFFGRVVMLLLPLMLIIYRKNIVDWFARRYPNYTKDMEELAAKRNKNKRV